MNSKLIITSIASMILTGCTVGNLSTHDINKPTLVFVHGAHLTGQSWTKVAVPLKAKGYKTLTVDLPGRNDEINPKEVTLSSSSKALCKALDTIHGPISFIAHSQGGAVVNNTISACDNKDFNSVIYVAAVAPLQGTKPFSLLSKADDENYFEAVEYDKKSGWLKIQDAAAFANMFTHSQSDTIRNEITALAVNEPAAIAEEKVKYAAKDFANLKKYYVYTKYDKVISLPSQQAISVSIKPQAETEMTTGHVPMLTQPLELAEIIDGFIAR